MKATYEDAIDVIRQLESTGFKSYLAGGCVRDILLNQHPADYDICTSATPEKVQEIFPKTVAVGESFGVVKVVVDGNRELDVATMRKDGQYSDGRHPETVEYTTSAEEDVKRRDFTINALLMDDKGNVLDYVGGKEDLKNKVLKTVGNPADRFGEDALRMMRAIRFSIRFKMDIDPATWEAIYNMSSSIKNISKERITEELIKTFSYGNCDRAFTMLHQSKLWDSCFGADSIPEEDCWEALKGLRRVQSGDSFIIVLGIILGECSIYAREHIIDKLVLTNAQKSGYGQLISRAIQMSDFKNETLADKRKMLQWEDLPLIDRFLDYQKDIRQFQILGDPEVVANERNTIAAMGWPGPLINGTILQEMGFIAGPIFTTMLDVVRDAQLEGKLTKLEEVKPFLLSKYPATPRMEEGKLYDDTKPRRVMAQCPNCGKAMGCIVSKSPEGRYNWSDVKDKQNISHWSTANFFHSSCCYARKKKNLFVEVHI